MIKKRKISAIAARILLAAILSGLLASPAWGQPPERVKVLIAFGRQPGPAEEALVRGMGGSIKYTYHLVPAIAATLPEPAISALEANPHVTRVEPDRQMRALDFELDNAWGVTRIGAGAVHNGGNKGDGVKLAIIDSGINYNHPDLDGNYAGGYDFVQGDGDPMDVYGHGTHVAGTACAEDNDNGVDDGTGTFGVVGVAPECALYALRVLDDAGYGDASDLIAAMQWPTSAWAGTSIQATP
jgi:subtilisin